jgi:hypothetical protein
VFVPAPEVIVQPVGTVHVYVVAFVTEAIEYVCPVVPGHCDAEPVIVPGVDGVSFPTVTAIVEAALVPHALDAVTLIFPFCPADPVVTVIELVVPPAVIAHPVGKVHAYDVAPATVGTEYV